MNIPKRVELVQLKNLPSSYKKKGTNDHWDVSVLKESAYITPTMAEAIIKLEELVRLNSGEFYITDLFRSWSKQQQLRIAYETGSHPAYAARPGNSFHQAGRAIDFSVQELNFQNIPKDGWLDLLWSMAKPLGFHPIIKIPDETASEAWHMDFIDKDWEEAYNKMSYGEVAKCCILDIGNWDPSEDLEKVKRMFLQAMLVRLGYYEVGIVDGIIGVKTQKIIDFLGLKDLDLDLQCDILSKRTK